MKTSTKSPLIAMCSILFGFAAPVTQGAVIYQDNFTGSGSNTLIGTTPTVTTGGKFWVRNDPSFAANGQAVANAGAYLPFTPVAGNVYTLQGTLNPVSSGGDGWFAFGFTTVGLPFNGSPSWFLVKPSNIGGDVYSVKNGSLTALGNVTNSSNVFTIALNTTGINWVSTFSVNGTVLDTQTFTGGAPAISYIGIYANADTLATGSRITNLELIYGSVSPTFSSWATDNAGGQTADLDWDNDGVPNGVEYFMNATAGFTANPGLVGNTVTWPNGGNIPSTDYGTQFVVQTSTDLVIWEDVGEGNLDTNDGSLSYTVSGPDKQFVRLKVTPN
jgi:hypothetical protein